MLTVPFGIEDGEVCPRMEQEGLKNDLKVGYVGELFEQEHSSSQESQKMASILVVALLSIVLELIAMFAKHHFLTILALLQTASLFLMGYFDRHSVVLTMTLHTASLVFSFVWLLVMASDMFDPPVLSDRTHSGFLLIYCFFATIVIMVGQLFTIFMLYPYRNSTRHDQLTVRLFGFAFRLNGAAKSPICIKLRQMEQWGE